MTVRELFEKDIFCDYLEVTVRENGGERWIYNYRIGKNVSNAVHDDCKINGEWKHMNRCVVPQKKTERKSPNGLMGVLIPVAPEKAPKEVMDLEVYNFRFGHLFIETDHKGRSDWHGLDINAYPKGWSLPEITMPEPLIMKNQITLFDDTEE